MRRDLAPAKGDDQIIEQLTAACSPQCVRQFPNVFLRRRIIHIDGSVEKRSTRLELQVVPTQLVDDGFIRGHPGIDCATHQLAGCDAAVLLLSQHSVHSVRGHAIERVVSNPSAQVRLDAELGIEAELLKRILSNLGY
ncbi:hypothetical protein D9M70_542030 [compost metagenome]